MQSTKTDTARTVRLLAPVAADLAAWRTRCGRPAKAALVLPHPSGHTWSKTAWGNWRRREFGDAREAAGIGELRPYDLRHTFASLLLAEGRSVHYVAEQLGHSAVMTLRTYGHVIAEYRDRQAIGAEAEIRAARGRTAKVAVSRGVTEHAVKTGEYERCDNPHPVLVLAVSPAAFDHEKVAFVPHASPPTCKPAIGGPRKEFTTCASSRWLSSSAAGCC